MMDLEFASFNVKPEMPYRYQVLLISEIAGKRPGEIMPFIMFDPRRKGVSELIKRALEEMGFLGVKMYPPLGYHPDPCSFLNDAEMNRELNAVYAYCEKESIPITTHCSRGGAYSGDLVCCRELALQFCQPSSWEGVLKKYPGLYLNFGHFGGGEDFLDIKNPKSWSYMIRDFMERYDHVYGDISYHDPALWSETSGDYFDVLNDLMKDSAVKGRIIFGTDWLMTRHTWKEKEYVNAYRRFAPESLQQIACDNPLNFLFPGRRIPPRIKYFFRSRDIEERKLPEWMRNRLQF
jgi:predicted TIM-barrel fold metal-dependent hydrolase